MNFWLFLILYVGSFYTYWGWGCVVREGTRARACARVRGYAGAHARVHVRLCARAFVRTRCHAHSCCRLVVCHLVLVMCACALTCWACDSSLVAYSCY